MDREVTGYATQARWVSAESTSERRDRVYRATIGVALIAAVAALADPIAGFAAAAVVVLLATLDWRLSSRATIASFAALVLLIPADLQLAGGAPVDLSLDRIAFVLILGAFAAGIVAPSDERLPDSAARVGAPLLWLLGIAALSLFLNLSGTAGSSGLKALLTLGAYVALYFVVLAISEKDDVVPILKVVVVTGAIVGLSALLERYTTTNLIRAALRALPAVEVAEQSALERGLGLRVVATAAHPIALGGLMAMLLPIALYFALSATKGRAWWVLSAAFVGASMLLSVSRSALLAGLVGFVTLFALWPKKRMALATLGVAGFLAVHMLYPGVLGAFRATLNPAYIEQQESADNPYNRVSDYPKVREMVPQRPVFGMGYNAFDPETYFFLDNQVLKFLLEVGVLGTLAAVVFVVRVARSLTRRRRAADESEQGIVAALLGAVLSFAFLSFFFDTMSFSQIVWVFIVLAALGVRYAWGPGPVPASVALEPAPVGDRAYRPAHEAALRAASAASYCAPVGATAVGGGVTATGRVPRVAVFTLTMDRLDYTKRMLASLATSTSVPFDHYIVDNASSDGTREFLIRDANATELLLNERNVGISEGSNQALDLIGDGYDYIVKVDNDCEFIDPGWLEALIEVCEARGRRIVLSPRVEGLGPGLEGGHPRSSWTKCAGRTLGLTTHVGGICALAPAEVYRGYRFERNPLHGLQDVLFSVFVRLDLGYEMGYVEDVRVAHMDSTAGQLERYPDYWELRSRQKREFYGERPIVTKLMWVPRRLVVLWKMDRGGLLEPGLPSYLYDRVMHRVRSLFGTSAR